MNSFTVREYSTDDIPALSDLWHRVFGDSIDLISGFFRLLPEIGTAAVAVSDGRAVGAAYAVDSLKLSVPGEADRNCAYIYAVAAEEAFRGHGVGGSVYKAACDLALARGAEILSVFPIPELYAWYEKLNGAKCVLYRDETVLPCIGGGKWKPINQDEYLSFREHALAGLPHLRLSSAVLEFERLLCEDNDGGLFSCDEGIAAAYIDDGICLIQELLCNDAVREELASSLGGQLCSDSVKLYSPGTHIPYISSASPIPPQCIWNISFD